MPSTIAIDPTTFASDYAAWQEQSRLLDGRRWVFIVGPPKTGTTWMAETLSAHPDVDFIPGGVASGLFPRIEAAMLEDMTDRSTSVRWPIGRAGRRERRFFLRQLYDRTVLSRLDSDKPLAEQIPQVILESAPGNVFQIPTLSDVFAGSKFIGCTRDVRDAAVSGYFHFSAKGAITEQTMEEYAPKYGEGVWAPAVRAIREARLNLGDERVMEVAYEDHKADPRAVVRRALEFLEIDASDEAVEQCVSFGDFKNRAGRKPGTLPSGFSFYRKGMVGDWVNHLPQDLGDRILRRAEAAAEARPLERWLRECLWSAAARRCRDLGARRVVLYGAGAQARSMLRSGWRESEGLEVLALIDDAPSALEINGVAVLRPEQTPPATQAVVIASDAHERRLADQARGWAGSRGLPVVRIYDAPRDYPCEDGRI